jgi:hypothetical protein
MTIYVAMWRHPPLFSLNLSLTHTYQPLCQTIQPFQQLLLIEHRIFHCSLVNLTIKTNRVVHAEDEVVYLAAATDHLEVGREVALQRHQTFLLCFCALTELFIPELALFETVGGEDPQQIVFGIFTVIKYFYDVAILIERVFVDDIVALKLPPSHFSLLFDIFVPHSRYFLL